MSDEKIARKYDESKNPGDRDKDGVLVSPAAIPGVPLRDLTAGEFNTLPDHLKANIDASAMYSAVSGFPKFEWPPEPAPEPEVQPEADKPSKTSKKAADAAPAPADAPKE